jgi:SagB-type dehydrogenase family enzyme
MAENVPAPDASTAVTLAAVYFNSFKSLAPRAMATGFRTNLLRHRQIGAGSRSPRPAEDFLLNSKLQRGDRENATSVETYFGDAGLKMLSLAGTEPAPPGERPLTRGVELPMRFDAVVARRRTVRTFTGDHWDFDHLCTSLRVAAGVTRTASVSLMSGGEVTLNLRATPSGGGIYPVELHVVALRVEGLSRGAYRFNPTRDTLVHQGGEEAAERFVASCAVPDESISLSRACAVIALVGYPWRSMRKYGPRGLRLAFLEAGAIAEHLNLSVTALGYGSVDCASFFDVEAEEALGLDGHHQVLLHTVVIGCPG